MNKTISLLIMAGIFFGTLSPCFGADNAIPLIMDVRTKSEWNRGHIEGAILIPYQEIGEKIGAVAQDKSEKIYVYCRSGRRSKIAKESIEKLGYKDVVDLGSLEDAAKKLNLKIVK